MLGKRHTTICREGWYYLFVLSFIVGGAIMREINLMIILSGMMVGPLLLNLRLVVVTLRGLNVARRLPEVASTDEPVMIDVTATNTRRRLASWAVVIEDRIEKVDVKKNGGRATARVIFSRIAPGATETTGYRGQFARRGRYRFGPMRVSTRFPLGLVRRTIVMDRTDELIVCPRPGELASDWLHIVSAEHEGNQRSQHQRGLTEGDFYGLRSWRSGDSRRWIHWRTTAKRGELTVRQFEHRRSQDLVLLADLWQPAQPTAEDADRIESAIRFLATAAADQCQRGDCRLVVGTAGVEVEWTAGLGSSMFLDDVMRRLALAEAGNEDRLAELLEATLAEAPREARVVVVGTRPINLTNDPHLSHLWNNPRRRTALERAACLEVGDEDYRRIFHAT